MKETITIELDRGESRVIFGGKEFKMKTAWLKRLSVNDLFESLKHECRKK